MYVYVDIYIYTYIVFHNAHMYIVVISFKNQDSIFYMIIQLFTDLPLVEEQQHETRSIPTFSHDQWLTLQYRQSKFESIWRSF